MLQALLKGKLSREQENMEDILTSNVFGLLRYVRPREGILKYLSLAEDENGERPLEYLGFLSDVPNESVEYEFWPWWEEPDCYGCEPDVVIKLEIPDKKGLLVLIEAKYLSGKSSEADESILPTDQLAREWDNLVVRAASSKWPVLIYLTAHYGYPLEEIDDAVREFRKKRPDSAKPIIYWLSWRHLCKVCEFSCSPVLADVRCLLERFNFKFFDGVILEYNNILWSFEEMINWQTSAGPQPIKWGFKI